MKLAFGIFGMVVITTSMVILAYVDWRIADGVFLFGYGQNLENLYRSMK